MTAKSKSVLTADLVSALSTISTLLPDNNTREISPQDVRDSFTLVSGVTGDMVDSLAERTSQRISAMRGGAIGLTPYFTTALNPLGTPLEANILTTVVNTAPGVEAAGGQFVATKTGLLKLSVRCCVNYSNNSFGQLEILKNGSPVNIVSNVIQGATGSYVNVLLTGLLPVVAADVVGIQGYHLMGGSSTIIFYNSYAIAEYAE